MQSIQDNFRLMDFINKLNLIDLQLIGRDFTWSNRRMHPVLARLDIFLLTKELEDIFLDSCQQAHCSQVSEHMSIALNCNVLRCLNLKVLVGGIRI